MGVPGIWWIDLRVDGVKKGSIARHSSSLPQASTVIAATFTSPIDALYLAAVFDPIFTASYPTTKQVEQISLLSAILRAFIPPQQTPSASARLVDLKKLIQRNPKRIIAVFPECTTSNGRGILPLSSSISVLPQGCRIYPINLRYAPADITTPIPWSYLTFLWNLLSRPTHGVNVRIAESITVRHDVESSTTIPTLEDLDSTEVEEISYSSSTDTLTETVLVQNPAEKKILDQVGESLARIGRIKRVGLGVKEKTDFVTLWSRK
jgi:hypothetical protein